MNKVEDFTVCDKIHLIRLNQNYSIREKIIYADSRGIVLKQLTRDELFNEYMNKEPCLLVKLIPSNKTSQLLDFRANFDGLITSGILVLTNEDEFVKC